MKLFKLASFILIIFFKTETLFSENNLFNVDNIKIEKKDKLSNSALADKAIKKGFNQLIKKILLKEDINKLSNLNFSSIKQLVAYYQITNVSDKDKNEEYLNFSVTFDKEKIHNLFYNQGVSYSEITDKELFILPVLIKDNEIFIFNNNFYYKNWNNALENELIEFILPLEKIEIIQNINTFKNNLLDLNVINLFQEYSNKNLAIIFIEENRENIQKIYIKSIIQGKEISKNLNLKKQKFSNENISKNIIIEIKKELIDLVKSKNLIDIRTPSFLNAKLNLNKKSNLIELKSRIKSIDAIENIYVQEFNKDYMKLRIKYLGKLKKIIRLFDQKNIKLELINDQWIIKTL
jgi:hypothetical protein